MLKKTITYENPFTGQSVTEQHYFHISKAALVEMDMEEHKATYTNKAGEQLTGMRARLAEIVETEDAKAIMASFKDFIRRSYGKKDGDRFRQSPEIWEEFESSEAYSTLFYELLTDAVAAAEFINGIVPNDLEQEAARLQAKAQRIADTTPSAEEETPDPEKDPTGLSTPTLTPRVLTTSEIEAMDSDELKSGLATGRYKLS